MGEPGWTTPFTETEALIAVMEGDEDALYRLLRDMTHRERQALSRQADRLANYADRWCLACDEPITKDQRSQETWSEANGSARQHYPECPPKAVTDG